MDNVLQYGAGLRFIVCLFVFKNKEETIVTVNGENYRHILDRFLRSLMCGNNNDMSIQQDGITC